MKKLFIICLMLLSGIVFGQNKKTDKILAEGKLLYRLEKSSWYGTDDFLERFPSKMDSTGGYISYETSENTITTIFFSRFNENDILVRYEFDYIPGPRPISIDTLNLVATEYEKDLIAIRQDAMKRTYENTDDFFTFYQNTSFNFIPLIKDKERKVFVLTGPQVSGVVIIGNDYLLNYDRKNNFKNKSKIHNSLLQFPYQSVEGENNIEHTYHSHVLTDYISSTDICTLLLYRDYIEWKQHIVISKKEVSIFNIENESIFTMKTDDWKKINNSEK